MREWQVSGQGLLGTQMGSLHPIVAPSISPTSPAGGCGPLQMYVDSTFGWPPDGDQYVATQLRDSLEPLLRKYAVDVTWHGHHHR